MNPHAAAPIRRDRLRSSLSQDGLDAILVSSTANVTYLTGFTGEASFLLLGKKKDILVSDARFTTQIQEECPGLEMVIRPPTGKTLECVADGLRSLGARSVAMESHVLTVADFDFLKSILPEVSWLATRDRVEAQRMIKDEAELAVIRLAVEQAEKGWLQWKSHVQPQQTEKECADDLERWMRQSGARGAAFPIIIAAGERAALPHAVPGQHSIGKFPFLLVDWGANCLQGYKSDLTRVLDTHNYQGKESRDAGKLREIHGIVAQAQEAARKRIFPGALAGDVDSAAREVISQAGYGEFFGHGLGHGFGLQIHEGPWLRPKSDLVLQQGMVTTLEPGIYIPGWGGVRIEDNFLVTAEGAIRLTTLPAELEANRL